MRSPSQGSGTPWRALARTSAMRLALGFALVQVGALALALLLLYLVLGRAVVEQVDTALATELQALVALPPGQPLLGRVSERLARRAEEAARRHYRLEDGTGRVLAGNLLDWPADLPADGVARPARLWVRDEPEEDPEPEDLRAIAAALPGGGRLLIAQGQGPLEDLRETALAVAASLFGASALLALAGGLLLGRRWLARIEAIDAVAARIAAGDLSQRLALGGRDDELDLLASHINAMLGRIEQAVAGMREVADNVAHDLRKPLARLKTRIEVVLGQPRGADSYREALVQTLEDANDLVATFDALLAIARLESGGETTDPVSYDLADLVRDLGELYAAQAEEAGRPFTLEAPERLSLRGVPWLLARALANLLDNAFHHTPPDTPVKVRLSAQGGWAVLEVADRGPGIPLADRERLTRRFTRGDAARSRPGSGLGLALAKAVAESQGGALELRDSSGGGLTVRLRLPL